MSHLFCFLSRHNMHPGFQLNIFQFFYLILDAFDIEMINWKVFFHSMLSRVAFNGSETIEWFNFVTSSSLWTSTTSESFFTSKNGSSSKKDFEQQGEKTYIRFTECFKRLYSIEFVPLHLIWYWFVHESHLTARWLEPIDLEQIIYFAGPGILDIFPLTTNISNWNVGTKFGYRFTCYAKKPLE